MLITSMTADASTANAYSLTSVISSHGPGLGALISDASFGRESRPRGRVDHGLLTPVRGSRVGVVVDLVTLLPGAPASSGRHCLLQWVALIGG